MRNTRCGYPPDIRDFDRPTVRGRTRITVGPLSVALIGSTAAPRRPLRIFGPGDELHIPVD